MVATADSAAEYVGRDPDDPVLAGLFDVATSKVSDRLGAGGRQRIPSIEREHAVHEAFSGLLQRKLNPSGVIAVAPDGVPQRLARDPMVAVYPLIDKYRSLAVG